MDPSEKSKLLTVPEGEARIRIRSDPGHQNQKTAPLQPTLKKANYLDVPRSVDVPTRTSSVSIFVAGGPGRARSEVVSTSYGPVLSTSVLSTGYGPVLPETQPDPVSGLSKCWGLSLAIISGLLFTASNFLFQYLNLNVTEVVFTRFGIQSLVLGLVLASTGTSPLPANKADTFCVGLQGLCAGARVGLTFACLEYMPLGDALTIIFTEPLWTILMSKFILGTSIGWWKSIMGVLLMGGVVLCTQPPFLFASIEANSIHAGEGSKYYTGVALALLGATTGASSNILIAKCTSIHSMVLVFYSGLGGCLLALLYSLVDPTDRINSRLTSILPTEWLYLGVLAGMGLVGYYSLTRSLQLLPPTTVAVLRAKEIVFAYILEACVTGHIPNGLAITGSSLVVFSVVATAVEESLLECIHGTHSSHDES